jgi:transposase
MGAPIKKLELSQAQKQELENTYKNGKTHALRKRCQMMLLKHQGKKSEEVAQILGGCEVVVNTWMQRYQLEGIKGLETKPGRGRKAILNTEQDLLIVKSSVQKNRQRLSVAKAELETVLGKELSLMTLQRYVKKMVGAINVSESVRGKKRVRKSMNIKKSA